MNEDKKMKMVCEYPVGTLRTATTVNNTVVMATAVKTMPGVGQPFLMFASLPANALMADFNHESIIDENGVCKYLVSSNAADNLIMINDMLANPPLAAITLP